MIHTQDYLCTLLVEQVNRPRNFGVLAEKVCFVLVGLDSDLRVMSTHILQNVTKAHATKSSRTERGAMLYTNLRGEPRSCSV